MKAEIVTAVLVGELFLGAIGAQAADVTFYTDEAEWLAAVRCVENLAMDANDVAKADEVATPPGSHTNLGGILTFDKANTGLSWSFELRTLQSDADFIFSDHPQNPSFEGKLSVGNVDEHEDDDWRLQIIDGPPLYACAFVVGENDEATDVNEFLRVFGEGGVLLGEFTVTPVPGFTIFGFVSSAPIARIEFDEDNGEDDIWITDFKFAVAETACQASFQGLGDLSGGSFESYALSVSADGSVVVGNSVSGSGREACLWQDLDDNGILDPGEMISLGDLPGGNVACVAYSVSADGSVVVGFGSPESAQREAFRWSQLTGMVGLGDLPGGGIYSEALGVSANGSVVVGEAKSASGIHEAFRWEDLNGNGISDPCEMVGMGDLEGGIFDSVSYDVSADGSVIVGWGTSVSGKEAFRWEDLNSNGQVDPDEKLDNHPEFGLGDLGLSYSETYGVSACGSVVVGWSNSGLGYQAFRWTNADGMVGLGDLPGGVFESRAYVVSAEGSVIVGYGNSASGKEAFIWDEHNGMRNLKDVLENDHGLDLTGWTLIEARGISADGLTIVGGGINPDGHTEAWIAKVCKPVVPDIEVSPLGHDFGDVELGTSRTTVVTISNVGTGDLTVENIAFQAGSSSDFTITAAPNLPAIVEPNETTDVEITFTPTTLGLLSADLEIASNDPCEPLVMVWLDGAGIEVPPTPSEQIAEILEFFDNAVEVGTIEGRSKCPKLARLRLRALRHMIKAAGELIDGGWYRVACFQLKRIYLRCDGKHWPPDFVQGPAVAELADMIQELRTDLDCE